jgi:outer membrane protein OmpU
MKKILLSTTALVAATAVSAGVAKAEMSMNGWMYQGFGAAISADKGAADDGGLHSYQNAQLNFVASTEMDSGMTMSMIYDFDADNDKGSMDEARFSLSDDWGTLQLGGDDTAADVMNVSSWGVAANPVNSGTWSAYVGATASGSVPVWANGFMATAGSLIGDAASIKYYSPDMSGFSFGVSYAPNTDGNTDDQGADTGFNNVFSAALKYSGEMDAVSITAGAGVDHAASPNVVGATTGGDDSVSKYNAGISLGMGGFGAGISYQGLDYKTSATAKVDNWTVATDLSYSVGQHSVSIAYVHGETNTGTNANDRDGDAYQLGYNMDLGSGVYWNAAVSKFKIEDNAAGNTTGTEADFTAFETGVGVSF